ncbi:MAG: 4Fe-4S dicluster domain-containing protein [Candidatus Caldatribacterium sp.]|nr:4Fe-4S dicluster domain-containing protein [Candidatus Caldatribacterium sp.]
MRDASFRYEVAHRPGGEGLFLCFSCGVCTATCPVAEVEEDFSPRRIIHQVLLGDRSVLESRAIWMCAACFRCVAHCPQGVEFANVLQVLREMAVERGCVPPEWKAIIEDLDSRTQKLRRDFIALLWEKRAFSFPAYEGLWRSYLGGERDAKER